MRLHEKYGDPIFFIEMEGKADVICFRDMAEFLINDKWYQSRKDNAEEEAERIVCQAPKIILGQLRSIQFDIDTSPANDEIKSIDNGKNWMP